MLQKYYGTVNNLLINKAMMSLNVSLTTSYKIINTVLAKVPRLFNTLLSKQQNAHKATTCRKSNRQSEKQHGVGVPCGGERMFGASAGLPPLVFSENKKPN